MQEGTNNTAADTPREDMLTVEQAAERMGLATMALRMMSAGEIFAPAPVLIDGEPMYSASAVDKWIRHAWSPRVEVLTAAHMLAATVRIPWPEDGDDRSIVHGKSDECASWCNHRHGLKRDQIVGEPCFGADQTVKLSLMPRTPENYEDPNLVRVQPYRAVGGPDVVMVQYNDGDELRFTPGEFARFLETGREVLAAMDGLSDVERARQAGYDAGYFDALSLNDASGATA